MSRWELPTDEKDLVTVLDMERRSADLEVNLHMTLWKVIDAYLAGRRSFRVTNRFLGEVAIAHEKISGDLAFRYDEAVRLFLVEMGRYMKMDITPSVSKRGESLGALREAAIANGTLGSLAAKLNLNTLKRHALIPFLKYGTVGIAHTETGDKDFPDLIEVVHPRELRGFPAFADGLEYLYGVERFRWVPLDWLEKRMSLRTGKKVRFKNPEADLLAREVPWGSTPPGMSTVETVGVGVGSGSSSDFHTVKDPSPSDPDVSGEGQARKRGPNRTGRYYVPLEEVFIFADDQDYIDRSIIKVGNKILENEDLSGHRTCCPLTIARHTDTGRFFSRGFAAGIIPFNDQIEKCLASLFKNIAEMDMFGTVFFPGGSGVDLKRWRTGPRPKAEKFEPDPISPGLTPFNLTPHNTGTMPAKVIEFTSGLLQKLAGQGPSYHGEASGRVDSAAGLGFLFNTGNIGLGVPTNGFADALAGSYRCMLQSAKDRMMPGDFLELALIDDAIAGIQVDKESGRMSLSQNPIPDPWKVTVDIRDRTPKDRDVRKQELLDLHQRQLIDDIGYWIAVFEENLDVPGAPKEIWETWRKAIWMIVVQFGDGVTPHPLKIGDHTQDPDTQLRAVQRFMNKIEYSLASVEVRKVFEAWKEALEILTGQSFPKGLGPPEEIAAAQQAGGQQPGGGQASPNQMFGPNLV